MSIQNSFNEMLASLSLIYNMDCAEGVSQTIAEYYGLNEYAEYFNGMKEKTYVDDYIPTGEEVQNIINKQNKMMEEIRSISPEQAEEIEEAMRNL